jgi:hypothetical protein
VHAFPGLLREQGKPAVEQHLVVSALTQLLAQSVPIAFPVGVFAIEKLMSTDTKSCVLVWQLHTLAEASMLE